MRLRLFGLSFLLACLGTGTAWLCFFPAAAKLVSVARAHSQEPVAKAALLSTQALLPLALGLTAALLTGLIFAVLSVWVGRPLEHMEATLENLGRGDFPPGGQRSGPLLARLEATLQRTAEALQRERQLTRQQVEQIRKAQVDLLAAERLATVGKLAAGVAHEVGNPLSGILGYLSLAKERVRAPEALQDFLGKIEGEVERIDGIVRGLLDLGRPARVEVVPTALASLVRDGVKLFCAGREQREVEVELACPEEAVVLASASALTQVLVNLLLNASQAMKGRGKIQVRVEPGETEWALCVLDSGPGFSPEVQRHLFEPFFTTKEVGRGTGLGLAVSKSLADGMGARLEGANREEGGAQLTLWLQRA